MSGVPVALHLDHGTSFEQVIRCIGSGFSSVMFDGSRLPLEENIEITRRVIEVARPLGVSVEAELGKIGGTEDDIFVSDREAVYTDPEEARYFVEQTGVDCLAIAIGTAHGQYKGEPRLDFDRLENIQSGQNPDCSAWFVGVPDDQIKQAYQSRGKESQYRYQYPRSLCGAGAGRVDNRMRLIS